MEEEARVILKSALKPQEGQKMHLAEEIRRRFAALGGFEMPDMPREFGRDPPDFSE